MSSCAMRQVPSGASGARGLNFLIFFFTRKFQETSVIKIFDQGKGLHRLDRHRFVQRQIAQARHAHQFRHAVHFRRARSAFARLAVPSTGEVVRLLRLDVMHGIEHDHAFGDFGRVIAKLAAACVAAPDSESGGAHNLTATPRPFAVIPSPRRRGTSVWKLRHTYARRGHLRMRDLPLRGSG